MTNRAIRRGVRRSECVGFDQLVAPVIASLPMSLGFDGAGELAAINGQGDWPAAVRAAMDDGIKGIVVYCSQLTPASAMDNLANDVAKAETYVVLMLPWSANPALADAASHWQFPRVADDIAFVDSVVSGSLKAELPDIAIHQLVFLDRLAGQLSSLEVDAVDRNGFALRAQTASGVCVSLTATITEGPAQAFARIAAEGECWEIDVEDTITFRPARAVHSHARGEDLRPAIYESAARATWRRLLHAMDRGEIPSDLSTFSTYSKLVEELGSFNR